MAAASIGISSYSSFFLVSGFFLSFFSSFFLSLFLVAFFLSEDFFSFFSFLGAFFSSFFSTGFASSAASVDSPDSASFYISSVKDLIRSSVYLVSSYTAWDSPTNEAPKRAAMTRAEVYFISIIK